MATARTCTTPEQGWALYSHFLGNCLAVFQMQQPSGDEENEERRDRREHTISSTWAYLTGNLYMVMRRMQLHGHEDTAAKMQQIIDMVVEQDLTDPAVCGAIEAKHRELDPGEQAFSDILARLEAERAAKPDVP
ncbi:hypothetical protein HY933_04040 [Candidatus Falkowbacteria bacterium]|nr:hypothetical protein [Candidatus Falkowbacteria bacterium]